VLLIVLLILIGSGFLKGAEKHEHETEMRFGKFWFVPLDARVARSGRAARV